MIHRLASTGNRLKIKFVPYKKIFGTYEDIMRRIPSLAKARRILGYYPKVSLSEGIRRTITARKGGK